MNQIWSIKKVGPRRCLRHSRCIVVDEANGAVFQVIHLVQIRQDQETSGILHSQILAQFFGANFFQFMNVVFISSWSEFFS